MVALAAFWVLGEARSDEENSRHRRHPRHPRCVSGVGKAQAMRKAAVTAVTLVTRERFFKSLADHHRGRVGAHQTGREGRRSRVRQNAGKARRRHQPAFWRMRLHQPEAPVLILRYFAGGPELGVGKNGKILHQYQFQRFDAVEGWVEAALMAFKYLEWYRVHQMRRRDLSEDRKRWWEQQRTYGVCQALRSASEQNELQYIADRLETPRGPQKLKRIIRNSFPNEYRDAA